MEKVSSYWNKSGKYQKQFDFLFKKLVPSKGNATTIAGEVLRAANKLYYERFNNGNMNAADEIEEFEGEGVYYYFKINEYYAKLLQILEDNLGVKRFLKNIQTAILLGDDYTLKEYDQDYEKMMNAAIEFCNK